MSEQDPATNHGFNYSSGMIQTWNQFCFTGGYIEVAVNLPGRPDVIGFWREYSVLLKRAPCVGIGTDYDS